jgi:uncharacterized protein (TIGR04255 family)
MVIPSERGVDQMSEQAMPYKRSPDLPSYSSPPVTQVDIGLHIQALKLRAVDLGDLYGRFRENYPLIEEHPPSPMQIERFPGGSPSGVHFEFQLLDRPPLPMLVFLTGDRSSLVQVDSSRFFCAWRRSADDIAYPSYEKFRAAFVRNVEIFEQFTTDVDAEAKSIVQAEVSYVNDIPMRHEAMPDFLVREIPFLANKGLPGEEEISSVCAAHHITYKTSQGVEYARLHISAEPVAVGAETALRLILVYRGEPREKYAGMDALSAVMSFLDEGHDRVVRAFTAYTTPEAHRLWGRVT